MLQALGASFERIRGMLDEQPSIVDGPIVKTTFERSIELEHVSFSYGGRPALSDITLSVKRGEFVALVGPSGAGKTTLADIILRLYDPQHGEVRVDGVNLRDLRQADYRRMFGVVSQESLLFHDSVRNNIRYGRSEISDEDVVRAAQIAHADEFIRNLHKATTRSSVTAAPACQAGNGSASPSPEPSCIVHRC